MRDCIMILAATGLVLSVGGAAVGAIWSVDPGGGGDFTTIQAAVGAASGGDTINVAAGTYTENVTVTTGMANLQILGAGSDVTHLSIGTGTGFHTQSPITVKGFDIYGQGRAASNALVVYHAGASGTAANPGLFQDNKIRDLKWGMKSGDWNIVHWQFKDNVYDNVYIPIGLENMSNVEVSGNKFSLYKEGVYGDGTDVAVKFNWFLGSDHAGTEWGAIVTYSVAQNWDIYGNYITDSIRGVYVRTDLAGSLTNVSVHCNNIVGNTAGIVNEDDVTLLAEDNWWGDASGPSGVGPGSGDSVTVYVDYDPWLSGPCPNAVPEPATLALLGLGGPGILILRWRNTAERRRR